MTTGSTYFAKTGDNIIDLMTHGYKWLLGADRSINWSISNGWNSEYWTNPSAAALQLLSVFKTYSDIANIKFNYAGYFATPGVANSFGSDINISLDNNNVFFNNANTWARGFFPNPADPNRGDFYLNMRSQAGSLPSYAPGSAGYALAIHEIGHTLGLKHPHDDGGTGRPTFASLGITSIDKDINTVMSYQDDAQWNFLAWDPATPMAFDALALQYLYGKNTTTNSDDTPYYIQNDNKYSTIWDAGGKDTVIASNAIGGWTIILPVWQYSSLVDTKTGAAVLSNQVNSNTFPTTKTWLMGDIENAIGSIYNDKFVGNSLNNLFDGKEGRDYLYFFGKVSDYIITKTASATIIVDDIKLGLDGKDTLINIERLAFTDETIAYDTSGIAGQAFRIYQAAFDRKPDVSGLGYWIAQLDNGASLKSIAQSFIGSAEFQKLYGSSPSNASFVDSLYRNVLHRAGEQGGIDYWNGVLNSGTSRADVLASFSESAENKAGVIGSIQNGIHYTEWTV